MRYLSFSILFISLLSSCNLCHAMEWQGIVPLKSKRADVERLLGPNDTSNPVIYRLQNETVFIEYSSNNPCRRESSSEWILPPRETWNVPVDTVVGIYVLDHKQILFSDLRLDVSAFRRVHGDDDLPTHFVYINDEGGFGVDVFYKDKDRESVDGFHYWPEAKQRDRLCPDH